MGWPEALVWVCAIVVGGASLVICAAFLVVWFEGRKVGTGSANWKAVGSDLARLREEQRAAMSAMQNRGRYDD